MLKNSRNQYGNQGQIHMQIEVIPGLYIGNFRDAKDVPKLKENNINHIVAIYDNPTPVLQGFNYKCVHASDTPSHDISKHFYECIKFIHKARISGNGVLVHCIAGVSRSTTIVAAYLITVAKIGWKDAIRFVQNSRSVANPNYGFQRQLEEYEFKKADEVRRRLLKKYPLNSSDEAYVQEILSTLKDISTTSEESTLNSETFRSYENKRVIPNKDKA
eukprot:gene18820-20716_t